MLRQLLSKGGRIVNLKVTSDDSIDQIGLLNVVPNSNLPGLRFFVYCICMIMKHSYLNDMEIPKTKRFILKGFELGTTLSFVTVSS